MSKAKNRSLASEISDLITSKAKFDSDDEVDETRAKVVDVYDEELDEDNVQESRLRKQNIQSLDKVDKRYAGKKVLRKDIYSTEFESDEIKSDNEEEEKDDDSDKQFTSDSEEVDSNEENVEDEEVDEDEEEQSNIDEESENESDENSTDSLKNYKDESTKISTITKSNIEEEIQKGKCVQNQIKLWENLLDVRIKFQKCLATSNKMPQYDVYEKLKTDNNFKKESKQVQNQLSCLLDKLLELESTLLSKSIILNNPSKENSTAMEQSEDLLDEEIPSDTENESECNGEVSDTNEHEDKEVPQKKRKLTLPVFEKLISKSHKSYLPYRNSEIQKWNDKTRIATAVVKKGSNQSILQQIDFILKDKSKLIKKTQLKRSEYEIVGKEVAENADGRRIDEYDSEIYDDDDFYHELLREFIHQKTSGITDPTQLGKQWVQLQSMRHKLKRKIETKATKGRKLRYNVHQKLLNYMAPILVNDTMSDHAKDELYNSLFSQMKTTSNQSNTM